MRKTRSPTEELNIPWDINARMKDLISSLTDMGILASPDAIYLLSNQEDPLGVVREVLAGRGELLILEESDVSQTIELMQQSASFDGPDGTPEGNVPLDDIDRPEIIRNVNIMEHYEKSDGETISLTKPLIPLRGVDFYRPVAAEYQDDITIQGDITGQSWCEGKISDFSRYFHDRLKRLRDIIKTKPEMMHAIPISRAISKSGEIATIGIVTSVRAGEKGTSFEIEDEDSTLNVFISKTRDPRLIKDVGTILNDEVIGVIGNIRPGRGGRGPSLYPKSIVRPPLPFRHNPSYANQDVSVAFVSDLHIGSTTFLKTEWKRALAFFTGKNHETREVASRIKYLVFTGDVVDGIGVYPGHDEDLDITDLFLQYEAIAEDLNLLPDHMKVIMAPGNHDGVRKAEPQPSFPDDIQKLFDPGRVIFTGNPITITLHGVSFLTYHGGGMDDIIPAIPGLTYENPIGAMREMMKRRHLVPIYGGKTPLAPEHHDYHLMDQIPDVFVTGHVHTTQIESFHNVLMINASCWMAQTAYQKMRDFVPDPAKLPIVRLDTLKPTLVQFGE